MIRKTIKDICDNLDKFRISHYEDSDGVSIAMAYDEVYIKSSPRNCGNFIRQDIRIEIWKKINEERSQLIVFEEMHLNLQVISSIFGSFDKPTTRLSQAELDLIYKSVNDFLSEYVIPTGGVLPIINFGL